MCLLYNVAINYCIRTLTNREFVTLLNCEIGGLDCRAITI